MQYRIHIYNRSLFTITNDLWSKEGAWFTYYCVQWRFTTSILQQKHPSNAPQHIQIYKNQCTYESSDFYIHWIYNVRLGRWRSFQGGELTIYAHNHGNFAVKTHLQSGLVPPAIIPPHNSERAGCYQIGQICMRTTNMFAWNETVGTPVGDFVNLSQHSICPN